MNFVHLMFYISEGVPQTIQTSFYIVMADRNSADGCIYKIAFRKQNPNIIHELSVHSYHDNLKLYSDNFLLLL